MLHSQVVESQRPPVSHRFGRASAVFVSACLVASLLSGIPMRSVLAAGNYALSFAGTSVAKQYVTFGQATPTLGTQTFTLEAWIKRASGGVLMGTGGKGLGDNTVAGPPPQAYPVITKGRGQDETKVNNMNYFFGITAAGMLAADFEDTYNGLNHPVWGTTTVPVGEWHHVAVTYGSGCWSLFVDGNADPLNAAAVRCPMDARTPTPQAAVPENTMSTMVRVVSVPNSR